MAEGSHLLTDIRLTLLHKELRPVYAADRDHRRVPTQPEMLDDLGTVSAEANLGQSVFMRLLTPTGELSALGHPEYGSRLHELIGRQNTATTRNLVKLYILESLQHEPRIEKVKELTVDPAPGTRDRVNVLLRVQPVGPSRVVTIGPFALELGS